MKQLILLITFLMLNFTLLGQEKKADKLYENLGYLSAADAYQKLEQEKMDYEIMLKLANSFRLNSQYESAEYWYAQIVNEAKENKLILHYAQTLQANGKCEDAIRWYKEYETKSSDKTRSFIEDCKEVDQFEYYKNIKLTNLGDLNTAHHDFSPVPYGEGIVFTSMRGSDKGAKQLDRWTNDNFSDLFFAKKEGESFKDVKALEGEVNGGFHDGVATFHEATKSMIFTRTSKKKSKKGAIKKLKIFKAKKEGNSWKEAKELTFCDKEFSTCHPTLSPDGQRLYFSSDRSGGFGGMDIYVSKRLGNKWGEPTNLGPIVNTSGNEIFPFISQKDKLFFASDGHKGIGGLDIFVVEKSANEDENSWVDRKNIGKPINSTKDDFGFYINAEEEKGYVSSNRPGGAGLDDIYSWVITDKMDDKDPFDPNPDKNAGIYKIAVCDADTKERLENARVAVLKSKDQWIAYEEETALPDKILTENIGGDYGIKVKGGVIRADASFITNPNGVFNYFLESNQTYSFYAEKDYYYPNRQQLTGVELIENEDYCIPLKRRQCVKLKGAVKNKNFPKYIPGAEVTLIDRCTGKITILETDYNGEFEACIECNCEYLIKARKINFKEGRAEISTLNVPCNTTTVLNALIELELDKLDPEEDLPRDYVNQYFTGDPEGNYQIGQVITLRDIYYDFDKYNIRADASNDLNYLILLMNQYPSMEISLSSHTDSRGTRNYNQWLSRKRAKSAQQYLIAKGVSFYRINDSAGFGETQPVNDCYDNIDCSEEEHQLNRRTEITITRIDAPVEIQKEEGLK